MAFRMNRSPNDEKLFHNENLNVVTLGRGGSIREVDISLVWAKNANFLVGRFSSLAKNLYLLIGGNHPLKNVVSTSPLDKGGVVREIFGKVRPDLAPLANKRRNPIQVIVGHDVWIGRGVTIMGGVKIGNGAVIGANSVVAKDIPPYAIAVGNPVRVVKYRFDEAIIKKFLAVKWWNWSLEKIADNFPLMNDVEEFLAVHYSPELEDFPEDEFTQKLNNFEGGAARLSFHPRLPGEVAAVA